MTPRWLKIVWPALLWPALLWPALFWPTEARAWGSEGHRMVCEIAWARLTPSARALVDQLQTADPDPGGGAARDRSSRDRSSRDTFAESCYWADEARSATHRGTSTYHYVNIEKGAEGFDLERDCAAYDCIVVALRRYALYLAREGDSDQRRAEALKFLAHFVGDAHQPLHAGYLEDRGGNDIFVDWFGMTSGPDAEVDDVNLHAVWDRRILLRAGQISPDFSRGLSRITDLEAAAWRTLDFKTWIDESYRLAVEVAYDLPEDNALGTDYFDRALPVVETQMRKAGVRLADLINAIASGQYH